MHNNFQNTIEAFKSVLSQMAKVSEFVCVRLAPSAMKHVRFPASVQHRVHRKAARTFPVRCGLTSSCLPPAMKRIFRLRLKLCFPIVLFLPRSLGQICNSGLEQFQIQFHPQHEAGILQAAACDREIVVLPPNEANRDGAFLTARGPQLSICEERDGDQVPEQESYCPVMLVRKKSANTLLLLWATFVSASILTPKDQVMSVKSG